MCIYISYKCVSKCSHILQHGQNKSKKESKLFGSPAGYTSLHLRVSRSNWWGQRWMNCWLNGLRGWSAPQRQHWVVWHGLALYCNYTKLPQDAKMDHHKKISEQFIIYPCPSSYLRREILKIPGKLKIKHKTQELHRRCITFHRSKVYKARETHTTILYISVLWLTI